jgi:hypothetical protein
LNCLPYLSQSNHCLLYLSQSIYCLLYLSQSICCLLYLSQLRTASCITVSRTAIISIAWPYFTSRTAKHNGASDFYRVNVWSNYTDISR